MSTIYCIPDYYVGIFLITGFVIGYLMPKIGAFARTVYERNKQD